MSEQMEDRISELCAELDCHYDAWAVDGCFAAKGNADRIEAELARLLNEVNA